MQVVSWNLFHGRAQPGAGHDLRAQFTAALAGWAWDVALLQEVPPWWPLPLARDLRASMRMCLTSRNVLPPVQRRLAERLPDVLKSWGGGCDAILVRGARIAEHRTQLLTRRPERRYVHGVRLADGTWVCNVHTSTRHPRERSVRDAERATAAVNAWSAGAARVVFGGDFNLPDPACEGFVHAGGHWVDHVFVRGPEPVRARALDAGPLSDHRPLAVELR